MGGTVLNDRWRQFEFFTQDIKIQCLIVVLNRDGARRKVSNMCKKLLLPPHPELNNATKSPGQHSMDQDTAR